MRLRTRDLEQETAAPPAPVSPPPIQQPDVTPLIEKLAAQIAELKAMTAAMDEKIKKIEQAQRLAKPPATYVFDVKRNGDGLSTQIVATPRGN